MIKNNILNIDKEYPDDELKSIIPFRKFKNIQQKLI
jgi:hypothetical protein